jgi:cytochrome c556
MKSKIALSLALIGVTAAAVAGPIEDQIRTRQSAYNFISWNFGKIKAQVIDNPSTYNKDQVAAAANAIAGVANSGLGALFGEGTDKGTGWHETKVKPEFFKEPEKVRKLAMAFNSEANEMAKVAATGNLDAIKAQFGKLGETCRNCHVDYRIRD